MLIVTPSMLFYDFSNLDVQKCNCFNRLDEEVKTFLKLKNITRISEKEKKEKFGQKSVLTF